MQRLAPCPDSRPQDEPGFNRLHHVCLLWLDYLRAESEKERHALLYEATTHLVLYQRRGEEGEEVIDQVWRAIRRRDRVYVETSAGWNYARATDDGKIATFMCLTNIHYPVCEGMWQSVQGRVEVYRVADYGDLLCVSGASVAFASVTEKAKRTADEWEGHIPCDSEVMRSLGPWSYVSSEDRCDAPPPGWGRNTAALQRPDGG
uniref:hypothetical protein n=1 Tax=Cupriavidus gilardii TaxID=82541 RepID=UPI00247B0EF5|nr:hypothetical protein [Cupriavidus gilardii]WDE72687.1 hypothetical protein [Cupriavidus gilardii]